MWKHVLLALAAATLVGALSASGGAAAPSPEWRVFAAGPNVPLLVAVSAVSSSDVWMAGTGRASRAPIVAHWDGTRLTTVMPFGAARGTVIAITASSTRDVWALATVGPARTAGSVIAHWDGTRWSRLKTPRLSPNSRLSDISTARPNDLWAAGAQSVNVTTPDLGGGPGTSGGGTDSVDRPLLLHWNGNNWRTYQVARLVPRCPTRDGYDWIWACATSLTAIDAHSDDDVWAIGTTEAIDFAGYDAPVLHWNGRQWESVKVRGPLDTGGLEGRDIVASPLRGAWVLGAYVDASVESEWRYLLIHVRAGRITRARPQTKGAAIVSAFAPTSAFSGWIVGARSASDGSRLLGPLIIRWDGRSVRIVHSALDRLSSTSLTNVSASGPGDVWAVGPGVIAHYSR